MRVDVWHMLRFWLSSLSGHVDWLPFLALQVGCLVLTNDLQIDHLIASVRPSRALFPFDEVIYNISESGFFINLYLKVRMTRSSFYSRLVMNVK